MMLFYCFVFFQTFTLKHYSIYSLREKKQIFYSFWNSCIIINYKYCQYYIFGKSGIPKLVRKFRRLQIKKIILLRLPVSMESVHVAEQ